MVRDLGLPPRRRALRSSEWPGALHELVSAGERRSRRSSGLCCGSAGFPESRLPCVPRQCPGASGGLEPKEEQN